MTMAIGAWHGETWPLVQVAGTRQESRIRNRRGEMIVMSWFRRYKYYEGGGQVERRTRAMRLRL